MKLNRVVAVGAALALTLGTPTAALAGGHGSGKAKGKTVAAQKQAKAQAAKAAAAKKKAEAEARSRFTFPGRVQSVTDGVLKISRKERGVVVTRAFLLEAGAVIKRDGARIALADVRVGEHVVAHGRRVGSDLKVSKLNVESAAPATAPAPAPAPVEPAPTSAIII